jgi:glycine oxidase
VKSWDVIIAGAGIIGVSLALELRERGATVLVLDRAEPGSEASSAAAGMLAPADPETPELLHPLASAGARMFSAYVQKIESAAGIQVDFRRVGTIALMPESTALPEYRGLSATELQRLEPSIRPSGHSAYLVREDSVDPNLLMRAALVAARTLGIEVLGHTAVTEIRERGDAVEVVTQTETFSAASVVDCRGAWAGAPVRPRKGQMLYVLPEAALLQHVLRTPEAYIVPRSSGKILIGATVEDVGFDKSVDPSAIRQLLQDAAKYLPELLSAQITHSWAGLRPGTPDDLPIIGPTDRPRLFAATGHFRNGILLAPVTAQIMADLVLGQPSPVDISAFAPSRFRTTRE